ncbi:MAG: L-seryl-tRNA(Sec) selenium transferase, partial [Bacillota bacterium]|nr:L-seryl-tRNA(Sec) selenium transferase [Bacillota bacterium]
MDYSWLPKVDKILLAAGALPAELLGAEYSVKIMTEAARSAIAQLREEISRGGVEYADKEQLFAAALEESLRRYRRLCSSSLRRVINATGVVLHTNLGRAVLAEEAIEAIKRVAGSYCNLELSLESGKRSSRYEHVCSLLQELCGAEDALVVNNNAGAVLLVLDALCRGGEAIVSRGQLVEIGGSFRVPEIMEKSGVRLREVGTTNKTHLSDYARAIGPETRLLLQVHPSNFKMYGFTESVSLEELVELGHSHGLPVMDDLGSGCLYPLAAEGIGDEPLISAALASGVDVLTFSGDKLLGGPQAGIILGKREYIRMIKENSLTRALRIDKFTLAALEATLRIYSQGRAREAIPTLSMITADRQKLHP